MELSWKYEWLVSQVEKLDGDVYTTQLCPLCGIRHPMAVRVEDGKLRFVCLYDYADIILTKDGVDLEIHNKRLKEYEDVLLRRAKGFISKTKVFSAQQVLSTVKRVLGQEITKAKLRRKITVGERDWRNYLKHYVVAEVRYDGVETEIIIDFEFHKRGVALTIYTCSSSLRIVYVGSENFNKKLREKIRRVVREVKEILKYKKELEELRKKRLKDLTKKFGLEFESITETMFEATLPLHPRLTLEVIYNENGISNFTVYLRGSWNLEPSEVEELLAKVIKALKSTE